MLKAGALLYAIIVSFIIGVIAAAAILLNYYLSLNVLDFRLIQRASTSFNSGVSYFLSSSWTGQESSLQPLKLFEDQQDTILASSEYWGLFQLINLEAANRAYSIKKAFLIGCPQGESALYLTDRDKPLSLCGNTLLKGTVYLPKAGVRRAYIEGRGFTRNELVEGLSRESGSRLPEVSRVLLDWSGKLSSDFSRDSVADIARAGDSLVNSFFSRKITLLCSGKATIASGIIKGKVVLMGGKELYINAGCTLEDVIVIAEKITIGDGFQGSGQFFASDSILIGKNCKLRYPSSIAVVKKAGASPYIGIDEGSVVSGCVAGLVENTGIAPLRIRIGKDAQVNGTVYCPGFTELRGRVNGSVYTDAFILTASGIYENHLLDAEINSSSLPASFAGPFLFAGKKEKKVVKWLR
jgi:hypothetical protein